MEFLFDYGLFIAKALTIVASILIVIAAIAAINSKQKSKSRLKITKLNDDYEDMRDALNEMSLEKAELKKLQKNEKKEKKAHKDDKRRKIFVINFNGDIRANAVDALRHEITAVLTIAKTADEVLVNLESPGGSVAGYGLAASQLHRLREAKIPLTVCVDKVAASGGYMMACVANQILAAPFSFIGSIGVVATMPNFNRWLKKHNVEYEMITAGEYKRTLTMLGPNTSKGRKKFTEDLEEIHEHFKNHIREHRPQVDLDTVATGEYWLGNRALELQLIDRIQTSDDYLLHASKDSDLIHIRYKMKQKPIEKLFLKAQAMWLSMQRDEQELFF